MSDATLGRMKKVDVREVWKDEAGGFTPWLVKEDNLALLADTVGIELELEATEKDVGPFRADILCKDTVDGHWVLIENQLEKTDHTHLGQLLTYAAGLKAVTIVWIAKHFTEEHRAALDWLNEITDDRFNFFGLEIELWKIGESPTAPKFNMACKPNEWTKATPPVGEITETKLIQQRYWAALQRILLDRNGLVKAQKPQPQNWMSFAIGRANFWLNAAVNTQKNFLRAALVCGGAEGKAHFHLLEEDEEAIEAEAGTALVWNELPNRKESRIELLLNDADPTNESDWPRQHAWLAEKLEVFHQTFSKRVKQLDASEWQPD